METRQPLPPFKYETAVQKVRAAERRRTTSTVYPVGKVGLRS